MIFDTKGKEIGIYAICIDGKIAYIGQSKQLPVRAQTHERNIRKGDSCEGNWYPLAKQFYEHGHSIELKILEEVEQSKLIDTEEKYISTLQPIFNTKKNGRHEPMPISYEVAANLLDIKIRPYVGADEMIRRDRAEQMGWFGEFHPNADEFYWWEYEQAHSNYKRPGEKK